MTTEQPLTTFLAQHRDFTDNVGRIYKTLDTLKRQIRLFTISSASHPDDSVSVALQTVSLNDPHVEYNAISYTWDISSQYRQILVEGLSYNVTVNQEAALKRFRDVAGLKLLWMDVLCINQVDIEERRLQVGIMGQIYRRSKSTQIWLGLPPQEETIEQTMDWDDFLDTDVVQNREYLLSGTQAPDTPQWLQDYESGSKDRVEAAFDLVDAMANNTRLHQMPFFCREDDDKVCLRRKYYSIITMVSHMLTATWFRRVWTVQEAVLSPDWPVVHYGSCSKYLWVLLRAFNLIIQDLGENSGDVVTYAYLWVGSCFPLLFDGLLRLGELNTAFQLSQEQSPSLFSTMAFRLRRDATEIRDHVYGILGFIPDIDFTISYTSSVSDVFARAVLLAERLGQGTAKTLLIDVRGLAERPNPHNICSWVPDLTWSIDTTKMRDPTYGFETNLVDHVVEDLDWDRLTYDPSRLSLRIPAVKLDVITVTPPYPLLGDQEQKGHFATCFVKALEKAFGAVPALTDRCALWRTVLHDRPQLDASRLNALDAIVICADQDNVHGCTDALHHMIDNWADSKSERFHTVMTRDGRLASVRPSAQPGDEIHVVMGCPLPIILRPIEVEDESDAVLKNSDRSQLIPQYQVVGPAYVDDLVRRDPAKYRFDGLIEVV